LWEDISFKADAEIGIVLVQEHLELVVRQLIPRLELPVVLCFLLDCIVSEVNQAVREVVDGELSAGSAEVSFFVNIHLCVPIYRSH
jgi:hypothetical protein